MEEYLNKPYWVIDILPKRKMVCEISPYRKGMEDYYNTYFLLIAFH
jgi:hypothetical protein